MVAVRQLGGELPPAGRVAAVALGQGEDEVAHLRPCGRELSEDARAGQGSELPEVHVPRRDAVPLEPAAHRAGTRREARERQLLADDGADRERVVVRGTVDGHPARRRAHPTREHERQRAVAETRLGGDEVALAGAQREGGGLEQRTAAAGDGDLVGVDHVDSLVRYITVSDTQVYYIQGCIVPAMTTTDPQRRLTRRRAETRGRLLAGAREVISEQGVHGASVEDICERAGFTRGAFYSNFSDKDELVLALFADDRAVLLERLRTVLADPPDDVVALMSAVTDQLEVGDPHQWFLTRTEMTLHALRTPSVAAALVADRAAFRAAVVAAVDEALTRTGRSLDLPVDVLVRTVEALHDGATAQSLLEPRALPDGTLQRQVLPRLMGPSR